MGAASPNLLSKPSTISSYFDPTDLAAYTYVETALGSVDRRNRIKLYSELDGFGLLEQYASYQRATDMLVRWLETHKNKSGNPTVAGFDGATWTPYLPLDFDHEPNPALALEWLRGVLERLRGCGVDLRAVRCYFSGGKGFHAEIPATLFGGFAPAAGLHRQLKRAAELIMGKIPFDHSVYDKLRLWRLENSRHGKTGLYKIRLSPSEVLRLGYDEIRGLAAQPRPLEGNPDLMPIADDDWRAVPELVELWAEAGRTVESVKRERRAGAVTDEARDRQTVAAIVASWPSGGPNVARGGTGTSRHTDYLMPMAGFLTGRTSEEHALALLAAAAREAADTDFLTGRDWETEIERLVSGSAEQRETGKDFTGLPTLSERFPTVAAVLEALWPSPKLQPAETASPSGGEAEAPAFPLEVLPPTLRAYVEACAGSMVVPPDFVAVPLLVLAGAVIGNASELELKPGWREGSNLYAALVGDPGTKKSPALGQAARPVYRIQKRLARQFDEAMAAYEEELARWEGTKKNERGPKPKAPEFDHVISTDPTTEALAPMLLNARGIALLSDEMTGWVKGMDQYRGGKGADRQRYLSMWSRTLIKVDRKGSAKPIVVPQPNLSVIGGIQPDLLPELADAAMRQDGFIDRLLWSFPDRLTDFWNPTGIELEAFQAIEALFWRLYSIEGRVDEDGELGPIVVRFDPAAAALWQQWYAAHAAEIAAESFPAHLLGPWAKLPAQLARITLGLHVLWALDSDPRCSVPPDLVSPETLGAAADLVDYFKGHARRAYRHLRQERRSLVLKVLQALKERGPIQQSVLLRDVFQRNIPADRLRGALEELEEAGLARCWQDDETGGRSALVWDVWR